MGFFRVQFCFLFLFTSLMGYGQVSVQKICYNTGTNQADTIRYALDTISNHQYYDCVVHTKWKLRHGSLFLMTIEKSTNPCLIYVVAPNKQSSAKKLKKNDYFRACFLAYDVALTRYSSYEWCCIQDIMLGHTTLHIPLKTMFEKSDSAIAPNRVNTFYTLREISSNMGNNGNSCNSQESLWEEQHAAISSQIHKFIMAISQEEKYETILQYVNMAKVIKSFSQWGALGFDKILSMYYTHPKTQSNPRFPTPKYLWERTITKKNFLEVFYDVLNCHYDLPLKMCSDIELPRIKLLYELDGCFTIRINWSVNQRNYEMVVNMEKYEEEWKITGINKNN